jgi:hypothetical protein
LDLNNLRIIVCGDSYCTSTIWDRYHFSQILADSYGYNVTNLAHGSFSNVGICFQIQQAITMGPDIIIYNTTDPGRFELVLNSNFDHTRGLKNIVYFDDAVSSHSHPDTGDTNSPIFSTNYPRIKDTKNPAITPSQIAAVDQYMKHFFDYGLKNETDSWMFGYWHQQIINAGIIPLRLSREDQLANPMYAYAKENPDCAAYYHTDLATQEILAKSIDQKLKVLIEQKNNLTSSHS